MNNVLLISSECYPAAKAGGMGDVVGALPIYLPQHSIEASAIIPKYKTKWFAENTFEIVYSGQFNIGNEIQSFTVEKPVKNKLKFPFYVLSLKGLFDRESIYLADDGRGFRDEPKRNIAFQIAVLEWLIQSNRRFDIIHVHDHMTGLIPFFMDYCPSYSKLKGTPTIFTIHNGSYRGEFAWNEVEEFLPEFDNENRGLLDWDGKVNSLATAIKCSWVVNTVSPSYMLELIKDSGGIKRLYESELKKCTGVLNGIDNELWDPRTDPYLSYNLEDNWTRFKSKNKSNILTKYDLVSRRPVIGFIGRFAYQKGADLLFDVIDLALISGMKFNVVVLGSGDKKIESKLIDLAHKYPKYVGAEIAYNEELAHQIYAGCDFLIMPSRFEPCGLNQLYAMRYGTVPIASHVGGLKDTVLDISKDGEGFVIDELNEEGLVFAIERALTFYKDKKELTKIIKRISDLDYSWSYSSGKYAELYFKHIK